MKFLDLFAGIGGFRMGMELAGHECVGYVEIDKFARRSYEAIFDTRGEWTAYDIRSVTDDDLRLLATRGIDVICAGFPCQAFSIAGKRLGFEDTRGTLFFEIARFAKEIQPRYLFLENVKGLLSHDKGRTFETILFTLDELGYDAEWQVLNSAHFGVPQSRERVFIIGHFRGQRTRKIFPITGENSEITCNIVGEQESKFVLPVLTPDREKKRQNGRRIKEPGEPMFTLTAQDRHGVLLSVTQHGVKKRKVANCLDANYSKGIYSNQERAGVLQDWGIRCLTPRECWRLQGFPDWAFDRAAKVNSDTQLYKQAGNSVTVNVIYEIAKRL